MNTELFESAIDDNMKAINDDYQGKRKGNINMLKPKFNYVEKGVFDLWLKSKNKLGGQHKIPRVQNDRLMIEELLDLNGKTQGNS